MLKSYKNLIVWQKSIDLVQDIYVLTSQFPKEETYGLAAQMRRSSISIPSNIAEGSRRKDLPEYLQFLRVADASSAELETQITISKRLYPKLDYSKTDRKLEEVQKMLKVLLRKLRDKDLKPKTQQLKPNNNGFTIIELLVSIGLFGVVVTIAVGGFVQALRTQRQASALIAAANNVSLALEQIAREVRTGFNFCPSASSCSENEIVFTNANLETVTYKLADGAIERRVEGSLSERITGSNVKVEYLKFVVFGSLKDDGYQPRITISLGVSPREVGVSGNVARIQTTISSRIPSS